MRVLFSLILVLVICSCGQDYCVCEVTHESEEGVVLKSYTVREKFEETCENHDVATIPDYSKLEMETIHHECHVE